MLETRDLKVLSSDSRFHAKLQ